MKRAEFPRRVMLAAWDRARGCCEICGKKLYPGDGIQYDHIIALENGGDSELKNCQVVCRACHVAKTADDMKAIVKGRKVRAQHARAKTTRRKMPYRKFNGDIVWPEGT